MIINKRPVSAIIDLKSLWHNFKVIRRLAGSRKIISIVKDDAYGHGAAEVVRRLAQDSDYFGVACVGEAAELSAFTARPFIVLGGVFPGEEKYLAANMIPVVFNFEGLRRLEKNFGPARITVEIDTGMGRTGFLPDELDRLISLLKRSRKLVLHGVMSHFSSAESDGKFTERQIKIFDEAIQLMYDKGLEPELNHIANSAGLLYGAGDRVNAVRPGIMLYGSHPSGDVRKHGDLVPVMDFRTKVISVKQVKKGSSVSYGRTFRTRRDSRIAVLAAGYGDGYPRHLSGRGRVYFVNKGVAPVAGRVTMDMIMADVTDLPDVRLGDEAVLWGRGHDAVHPDEVAAAAGTISYELFCGVSGRVGRVYRNRT